MQQVDGIAGGLQRLMASGEAGSVGEKVDVQRKLWLEAWHDAVAGIKAYTPCVTACNLHGDGEWRLVVADADKKLKVRARGVDGLVPQAFAAVQRPPPAAAAPLQLPVPIVAYCCRCGRARSARRRSR